jgi:peptidyl-prolyl cis-trans isomerase D
MKHFNFIYCLTIVLLIAAQSLSAQETHEMEQLMAIQYVKDRIDPFAKTTNDQEFVNRHSDHPYKLLKLTSKDMKDLEAQLMAAEVGQVKGPYVTDVSALIYKVISFDSAWKMRASQILIRVEGPTKADTLVARRRAEKLMETIRGGVSFAGVADQLNGADGEERKKTGGDLGWFFEGQLVPEFTKAVMDAKDGDLFVVQTRAGMHVVLITAEKFRTRSAVNVVPLVKDFY